MRKNQDLTKSLLSRYFNRFETLITTGIIIMISIMILAAFWGLMVETYHLVHHGAFDKLDHKAFQSAFDMIMTLLIAIEFSYTIMNAYMGKSREIIVKNVVLVSILAVARQFIVFEVETISPWSLFALAASLLSLGIVYWLMGRRPPSPDAMNFPGE
ncbi:MAG TPA: phosphate-starvation-inducible PsiE family protein [Gallionella sp.]|nr:phosphate-starvation-inducible PsiE family protein [Gallionella sp.]